MENESDPVDHADAASDVPDAVGDVPDAVGDAPDVGDVSNVGDAVVADIEKHLQEHKQKTEVVQSTITEAQAKYVCCICM